MLCKVEVPVRHSSTDALLPGQVLDKRYNDKLRKRSEFGIGSDEGALHFL